MAIAQNELRVNNWVDNLSGLLIQCTWENIKWCQDVNPIKITAEILIELGFKPYVVQRKQRFERGKVFLTQTVYHGFKYGNTDIHTLHHLQNCVFFMTNEELKYKP